MSEEELWTIYYHALLSDPLQTVAEAAANADEAMAQHRARFPDDD